MNERLKIIRKEQKLSQKAFAESLNLSENFVYMIEKSERVPSDRTIKDVCRLYNVNEEWLRTGVGDPYQERTRNQQIADFLNDVMEADANNIKKRLIVALSQLDQKDWDLLADIASKLAESEKEKKAE